MSTGIEWVKNKNGKQGETLNIWTGCDPVSEGCKNCYARTLAETKLKGKYGYPLNNPFQVTLHPDRFSKPARRNVSTTYFICSMSDFFHEKIEDKHRLRMFEIMKLCNHHIFIILTKRSENMIKFYKTHKIKAIDNLWVGVTIELQKHIDRLNHLRGIDAKTKFVSFEPLLGEVKTDLSGIDLAIVGGETGKNARDMVESNVETILNECNKKSIHFFFKKWKNGNRLFKGQLWEALPKIA